MKLAIFAAAILLLSAGLYVYNVETPRGFKRFGKNAFHGLSQTRVQTLSYSHHMLIDTTQTPSEGQSTERIRIVTDSVALIEPIYYAAARIYTIQLSFNAYNLQKLDLIEDNTLVNYVYNANEEVDLDIKFDAVMDAVTGELRSINRVPGPEFEMIDTVAKDLLRQAFPSIKRQGFLLGQSEESQEEEIEFGTENAQIQVDLGTVDAEVTVYETEESIVVSTTYDQDDFMNFQFDLGGETPEVEFEEIKIIDKELGLLSRSERVYTFQINKPDLTVNLNQSQEAEVEEMMGSIFVEVSTEVKLEDVTYGNTVFENAPIASQPIDLSNEEGEFWMAPEVEEEMNLQAPQNLQQIYTKDYTIFEKNIFKQTFGMVIKYANMGETSNVKCNVYVNSKTILNLFDFSYKHCPGNAKEKNSDSSKRIPLFRVGFPILYIITVNVDAALTINYGFRFIYGSSPNVNGCNMTFQPYFKPGFEASGYVGALVARAGVYSSGTVANSYLNFITDVWGVIPFSSGKIDLNVQIVPFEYDVGAFYQLYKCSLKKLFTFKWKKLCSWGDRKQLSIAQSKQTTGYTLNIFSTKWGK